MKKIIFSYCRVSTSEQTADGSSGLENQQYINNQAIVRLNSEDEFTRLEDVVEVGSAFKGLNLSNVLESARSGKYPAGSIVVMFDQTRFSREDFFDALTKMREIVVTGLKIHFSTTGQTVGKELLEDFGGFVAIAAQASAANAESRSRSNRTLASYNNKIANNELVSVGAMPNWLAKEYDLSGAKPKIIGYVLVPERQKVIQEIYRRYIAGEGATKITAYLNANVEPWPEFDNRRKDKSNRVWRESYVTKLLVNSAIIGKRIFHIGKPEQVVRDNYYPPVVTKAIWYQAQDMRATRAKGTTGGFKYPTNIYSGLVYCGYCGSKYGLLNLKTKSPVIRCTAYAKKEVSQEKCPGGSSGAKLLERFLVEFCSDEINYDLLFGSPDVDIDSAIVTAKLLNEEVEIISEKLTRLEDLYLDSEISKERYIQRKSGVDSELLSKQEELGDIEAFIDKSTHKVTNEEVEYIELINQVKSDSIPEDIRLKIRDLLPKFIKRIEVHRYGVEWSAHNLQMDFIAKSPTLSKKIAITPALKDRKRLAYSIYFHNGAKKTFRMSNDGKWMIHIPRDFQDSYEEVA